MNFLDFKQHLTDDAVVFDSDARLLLALAQHMAALGSLAAFAQSLIEESGSEAAALDTVEFLREQFNSSCRLWSQEVRLVGLRARAEASTGKTL